MSKFYKESKIRKGYHFQKLFEKTVDYKMNVEKLSAQLSCIFWISGDNSNYTVSQEFPDLAKNMLLLKNPQFLLNHRETLSK